MEKFHDDAGDDDADDDDDDKGDDDDGEGDEDEFLHLLSYLFMTMMRMRKKMKF